MTDEETTTTEKKDTAASLPCLHAASLPCSQAASSPCLQAAELPAVDAMESMTTAAMADAAEVAEAKKLLLSHSLPKARQRRRDFSGHLRQEVKASRKPLFGFPKLSLRFICWLLPDPLDLLLNHICLHN